MNCNNISKWTLLGLLLSLITNIIYLNVEIVNQRCDKSDKRAQQKRDEEFKKELENLKREVSILKNWNCGEIDGVSS